MTSRKACSATQVRKKGIPLAVQECKPCSSSVCRPSSHHQFGRGGAVLRVRACRVQDVNKGKRGSERTQSAGDNETGAGQGMGMRAPRCWQGPRRAMMKGRDQVGSGWDGRGAAILYISCESKKRRNFYFHDVILFSHTSGPVYYPISSMNELLSFLS